MLKSIIDLSLQKIAFLTGVGYLIIFITGIFANFTVLGSLVIPGDAAQTAADIKAGELSFTLWLLIRGRRIEQIIED
jgi:hypothetical protein